MLCVKTKVMERVYTEHNETCLEMCNKYHRLDQCCVTRMSIPSTLSSGL